jgi:hypothetical protein
MGKRHFYKHHIINEIHSINKTLTKILQQNWIRSGLYIEKDSKERNKQL